jgi:hypothetical protein
VLPSGRKKEVLVLLRLCYWEVSNVFGLDSSAHRGKCDQGRCADGVVFVLPSGRKKEVSLRYGYWEVSNVFGLDA